MLFRALGARTSQLTAVAARDWPAELRPDAFLLIASSQDLKEVAVKGSLATASGLPARLEAEGWTEADIERYLPLLEPRGGPVMAPAKIVLALGAAGDLTPFGGGLALAWRWQVQRANPFLLRPGHFPCALAHIRRPPGR